MPEKAPPSQAKGCAALHALPAGGLRHSAPLKDELQAKLAGIEAGKPETYNGQLKGILNNASIFGVDLTTTPLADKIEQYFVAELAGPGAVRKTLHDTLAEA